MKSFVSGMLVLIALVGLSSRSHIHAEEEVSPESPIQLKAETKKTVVYFLCRLKSSERRIVRTLKVLEAEGAGDTVNCNTVYTKAGVDRTVGWGRHRKSCMNVLNNIKQNLFTAGWRCKDISAAKVSSGEPES